MSYRFPKTVRLTIKPPKYGSVHWELRLRGGCEGRPGQFLADGLADDKTAARAAAWHVCEQTGLVVDE